MGLMYLESQKQSIATSVAAQNAMNKNNPNLSGNFDFASSSISIFSDTIKNEIRAKAAKCNDTSSHIIYQKQKGQSEVAKSVNQVNQNVAELEALINWANSASKDVVEMSGISTSALNSIKQNMSETIKFGSSVISKSVSQANEALAKVDVPVNNPLGNTIKTVKNNLQEVAQNTTQKAVTEAPVIIADNQQAKTEVPAKAEEHAKTETPAKTEAPAKNEDVKTETPVETEKVKEPEK